MPAVYALHGFLGLPGDWDFLDSTSYPLEKVDLFSAREPSMAAWARSFNAKVRGREKTRRALLGYSMGGRLALHALLDDPGLWSAALIVSANPGIARADLDARLAQDSNWARRFETEAWDQVVSDWNRQPVFDGSAPLQARSESDFSRPNLVYVLRNWSPAATTEWPLIYNQIAQLTLPIAWIAGSRDARYAKIADRMGALPGSESQIIAQAGHRVPWDQPEAFKEYFCGFLERSLLKTRD